MSENNAPLGKLADAPAASAIGAMQDPTKPPSPPVDKRLTGRRMLTVALLLPLFMLLVMPAVFATGMIVYGWAVFGIFSGIAIMPWLMMYLLSLTALSVTSGLMLALGPVALPIAILLIPMLGMSSSGVSAPLDVVGGFYGAMHTWEFSAQGIGAVRDALYFEDTSLLVPVLVMLGWLVVGAALAAAGTVRQKRRHLFAQLSAQEETSTALAAGAAAV